PDRFACYQTRIKELDGYRIVEARFEKNVLIVVGMRSSRYDRFIFRFRREFDGYDVRSQHAVDDVGVTFTALDNGMCLSLTGEDLELFKTRPHDDSLRVVPARELGAVKLFHHGTQALFAKSNRLFKFGLR